VTRLLVTYVGGPGGKVVSEMILARGLSDQGRVRKNNEDNFAILLRPSLLPGLDALLVVADGMGGVQAGEVASALTIRELTKWFSRDLERTLRGTETDWEGEIADAIGRANQVIWQTASNDSAKFGMGTTVVVAMVVGDRLTLAHVGDSRGYLVSDASVYQITDDHSWVAEQVRAGALAVSDARRHPRRNILTRALGVSETVATDVSTVELMPGDRIVLCTDGLHGMVEDDEIRRIVSGVSPDTAVQELVNLANARGAPDNVTVVVGLYS